MITTLFDDDTDIETEDEEGTLVVATPDSTRRRKRHRYDDDMITRRVRAKRSDNEQIKALTSHVIAQRKELTSLKQLITRRDDVHTQRLQTLSKNVVQLMKRAVPTVRAGNSGNSVANRAMQNAVFEQEEASRRESNARLSSHPRCLHMLWNEFEFGCGVNKAAKLFTAVERGKVKHKYCLRKVFWDTVNDMVLRGWAASTACEKIRNVYIDQSSISKILFKMRSDRNSGSIPNVLRGNPV